MEKTIVGVQYESRQNPGQFDGRQYSYFSDFHLEVGDVIVVPVKTGQMLARVAAVGLAKESIAGFEDAVKTVLKKAELALPEQVAIPETVQESVTPGQELMVVKQIPIIEEQLRQVKEQITARVSYSLALVCNEDTYKDVKTERAAMRQEFAAFEAQRKEIKNAILTPYENFNRTYEDCVANIYKSADAQLKDKIDQVEGGLKQEKEEEVRAYFAECLANAGIDFVTFADTGITIGMSTGKKKLKETVKKFVDNLSDELAVIELHEHKEEILVEYKQTLNMAKAITTVNARRNAVEFERKRAETVRAMQEQKAAAVSRVEEVVQEEQQLMPPEKIPIPDTAPEDEPTIDEANWKEIDVSIKVNYPGNKLEELIQLCKEFKEKLLERGFILVKK